MNDAPELSKRACFVRVQRALGWFKGGHTALAPLSLVGVPEALASRSFSLTLPLQVRMFHDGLFVTAIGKDAAILLATRITQVGRLSAQDLVTEIARGFHRSDAWVHEWAKLSFHTFKTLMLRMSNNQYLALP